MASFAYLRLNIPTSSSQRFSQLCYLGFNQKHNRVDLVSTRKRHGYLLKAINDNGPVEPATRIVLERLFEHTQKLEEQMASETHLTQDVQLALNLPVLESDLQAALTALKKKEEHLKEAQWMVLLENSRLSNTKEQLEQQEKEIAVACSKYEKLEEELKTANHNLASQARQIENLKFLTGDRDQEYCVAVSRLSQKEEKLVEMREKLAEKIQKVADIGSKFTSSAQHLTEANKLLKQHELELQELWKAIQEKEEQLKLFWTQRKLKERLRVAAANLEKQAMQWLLEQEEVQKLRERASRNVDKGNEILRDFLKVKKILIDMRSELVSFQNYLMYFRKAMEEQEQLFERILLELAEERQSVMSYMAHLKDTQREAESKRETLRIAVARIKEIKQDLLTEKELMQELQEELRREKSSLLNVLYGLGSPRELKAKKTEFGETTAVLQVKESELVELKLKIQHLKSEKAFFQLTLEEQDLKLSNARKKLGDVNQDISDLMMLINSRERQLIQAIGILKQQRGSVATQAMQNELVTNLEASEAGSPIERVIELLNKLVTIIKDENINALTPLDEISDELLQQLSEKPSHGSMWQQNRLQNELKLTKASLQIKEMEVLSVQRALTIKDEKLKVTLERLDAKEEELKKMREEVIKYGKDHKRLYAVTQKRSGEKSMENSAIEEPQLVAALLEIEAITRAFHKLEKMNRELLNNAILNLEADMNILISQDHPEIAPCFAQVETAIARLSALAELLVKEARIAAVTRRGN